MPALLRLATVFSWNVSQPSLTFIVHSLAVAYMIRSDVSRRTRRTLYVYLNRGMEAGRERESEREREILIMGTQYYNILLFSAIGQPAGGGTEHLHAATA